MQRRVNLAKRLELYRSAQSEIDAVAWSKQKGVGFPFPQKLDFFFFLQQMGEHWKDSNSSFLHEGYRVMPLNYKTLDFLEVGSQEYDWQ